MEIEKVQAHSFFNRFSFYVCGGAVLSFWIRQCVLDVSLWLLWWLEDATRTLDSKCVSQTLFLLIYLRKSQTVLNCALESSFKVPSIFTVTDSVE